MYASTSHTDDLPSPSLVITTSKTRRNSKFYHLHDKANGFRQVTSNSALLPGFTLVQSLLLGYIFP